MSVRYEAKAVLIVNDYTGQSQTIGGETVFEPEHRSTWIGLYNASGVPIYRTENRQPIGFLLERRAK